MNQTGTIKEDRLKLIQKIRNLIEMNNINQLINLINRSIIHGININYNKILNIASDVGNKQIVELALNNNAIPNNTSHYIPDAVAYALVYNRIDILKLLLENGADVDKLYKYADLKISDIPDIPDNKILCNLIPDVDNEDNVYFCVVPLMIAIINNNKLVVEMLLKFNANTNIYSNILLLAIDIGNIDIIKLLIDNGCDINKTSYENRYHDPLLCAIINGNMNIIKLLIDSGAVRKNIQLRNIYNKLLENPDDTFNRDVIMLLVDSGFKDDYLVEEDNIKSIILQKEIDKLKYTLKDINDKNEELKTQLLYQPGGKGYLEAKEHFEKNSIY